MKKLVLASLLIALLGFDTRAQFTPKNLVVLRVSNVLTNVPAKQGQIFVDQFDPNTPGGPTFTVAVPTNGSGALELNGQGNTEGALSRSADHSGLAIIGYAASLGSISGTPSSSTGPRGIGRISIAGVYDLAESSTALFGVGKTNPRGVATDGTNSSWAGGGAGGTLYVAGAAAPVGINDQVDSITCEKMINGALYISTQSPAGIYNFVDANSNLVRYPVGTVFTNLVLTPTGGNNVGFDMNTTTDICYVADTKLGVQKYTYGPGGWQLAYTFGLNNPVSPKAGCFGLAVDFSGDSPIIYATTTETNGAGNINTNRLIRIVDTNSTATITTLATASADDVFKGLDFTPDDLPFILAQPRSLTVLPGTDVTLSVTASSKTPVTYEWLKNGTALTGVNSATVELNSVTSAAGGSYQVIITNNFGSVTSLVAILTVSNVPPSITVPPADQTNTYGNSFELAVGVGGTPPFTYRWYHNNSALSDGGDISGSATAVLTINPAQPADAGNYDVVVANSSGSVTSAVAVVYLSAEVPSITSQPVGATILVGQSCILTVGVSGSDVPTDPLVYTWYKDDALLTGGAEYQGLGTASLAISPAQTSDSGSYKLVVANSGGSATSQPAAVSVVAPPSPSHIPYTIAGAAYTQDFNSLPDPGLTSVDAGDPVTIGGITYSLNNPWDFAFPALATGDGGLGLPVMAGWYGWVQAAGFNRIGASCGDSTTGGIISFGLTNSLAASTNRALGLITTSSTLDAAFAALLINDTTNTLKYVNLSYTGEVWRQSSVSKTMEFYYILDPAGTASTLTNAMKLTGSTFFLPALNVAMPVNAADTGGAPVDGTQATNQVSLGVSNQVITNWLPGEALWLVWEYVTTTSKAQGLAIDNLSFAASYEPIVAAPPSLSLQTSGGNVVISWPASVTGFSLQQNASLSSSAGWAGVSEGVVVTNGLNTVTVPVSGNATYYRLKK